MVLCVEYIWIDNDGTYRSKCKVFQFQNITLKDLPSWNFDGSSTKQNTSKHNTEVVIRPAAIFNDPFRGGNNKLVLCDCYDTNDKPHSTNTRYYAQHDVFSKKKKLEPWFGLEQEYFILDQRTEQPLGYHPSKRQGQFYAGVGHGNAYGRSFAEYHLNACLKAGIKISGINAEVAPGQWEFQIGPCVGIDAGDHLHIARYLLYRVSEVFNFKITIDPKPLKGNQWNGSGCHVNFSTKKMRDEHGYSHIEKAIKKLEKNHDQHIRNFGDGNEERMTGMNETASYDKFSWSVGGRDVSVRVRNDTFRDKRGYFEDRRPSSNCDPYIVTAMIFASCCL
jgi:glutamine synthetase